MNDTGGIRVRRDAGDWVRTRVRTSGLVVVALVSGLSGLLVGIGLAGFVGWRLVALPAMCLVAAVILLARRYERGSFSHLLKGAAAERNVGGSIEYAITAPGCAVAHSVTEIARIGDIDHSDRDPQLPLGGGDEVPHGAQGPFFGSAATHPRQPGSRSTVGAAGRRGSGVSGVGYGKRATAQAICTRMDRWRCSTPNPWFAS